MWSNLSKPLLVNNKAKFIKELSLNDVLIFESVAYIMLNNLNYKLYNKNSQLISHFSKSQLNQFNLLDSNLRLSVIKKAKSKDLKLRMPQENFLKKILDAKSF